MTRFDACLPTILRYEGGFINDPADPGGATNRGVTQAVYDEWRRGQTLPTRSVREIEDSEVSAIYRHNYWDKVGGDKLPAPLDLVVFDSSVNHGTGQAIKFLQRAVGANADGVIGPLTLGLVAQADPKVVAQNVIDQRRAFYNDLATRKPTMAEFLRGWLARMDDLQKLVG